ncbi:MAG: hypothetical protein QOK39_703, partial [Acidimicrobiaceae bacterium]|nr:hypothetical protein [Acidimicrobiaceae bacterium]
MKTHQQVAPAGPATSYEFMAPAVRDMTASAGRALDPATREVMEQRLGRDFSGVRVHSGERPDAWTRQTKADAFTVGQNIAFAAGRYSPATLDGQRLLAHELVHTVQQEGAAPPAGGLAVSHPDDTGEREAAAVAVTVARGGSARPSVRTPARIAREPRGQAPPASQADTKGPPPPPPSTTVVTKVQKQPLPGPLNTAVPAAVQNPTSGGRAGASTPAGATTPASTTRPGATPPAGATTPATASTPTPRTPATPTPTAGTPGAPGRPDLPDTDPIAQVAGSVQGGPVVLAGLTPDYVPISLNVTLGFPSTWASRDWRYHTA